MSFVVESGESPGAGVGKVTGMGFGVDDMGGKLGEVARWEIHVWTLAWLCLAICLKGLSGRIPPELGLVLVGRGIGVNVPAIVLDLLFWGWFW